MRIEIMSLLLFITAVATLLATPGPTNTLLAASGATKGFRASLALLPAELLGYFVSINLLMTLAVPLAASLPLFGTALKGAAALWLVYCAFCLWRHPKQENMTAGQAVSFGKVFTTTLLNPKGLIFAFAIFPQEAWPERLPWLALFALLTLCAGSGWIALGRLLFTGSSAATRTRIIWRLASIVLLIFASVLAASAVQTLLV